MAARTLVGDRHGLAQVGAGQDDAKLLASEAAEDVALADGFSWERAGPGILQQPVAGLFPWPVGRSW
jgi:hypothetical protein